MSKIEILAPVGSEEMLHAAVFSGADAVYLGFSGFNARTSAGNFDADSLKEAVRFCHVRGVKVHVALNTTVYGTELAQLADAVRAVAASGADAVICQDLAVATLIGKIAPQLPRHGSTQMSVHSLQGALELKELGFTRVVLARELSLPEVEHITKHCGIETECFVHGALCMCVSGQCYMSAFLGGRSGNRGSCAGPCRLPFEANALPEGKPGRLHHLSLKDNSVIDKLDKLQALGVASAKIEGRLRTPEYVAAAVSACLAGREGRAYDRDLLKNAFSRSGFTSGYLDGKIDGTMFGVRSEADAEQTKKTLPMLRELYRRERSRVPVKMKLEIEEGGEKLTATGGAEESYQWITSDSGVLKVSDDGTVSALTEGSAVVTVTCGDENVACAVTVQKKADTTTNTPDNGTTTNKPDTNKPDTTNKPNNGNTNTSSSLKNLKIKTMYGTYLDKNPDGQFDMTVNKGDPACELTLEGVTGTATWKSSNTNVVKVSEGGTVERVGSGTATITITLGSATAEILVRVN